MASLTFSRVDLFPNGTTVEARKRTLFGNVDPQQGVAPPGAAETSAVSNGVSIGPFALADSTNYVLSGQVGGVWKHTNVFTGLPRSSGSGSGATRVTSLPSSPSDGQEIVLEVDAAKGILWHLRYNAASASPYKWEYVGGPALYAKVDTAEGMPATYNSFIDLTTAGPTVTLPTGIGGDFEYECGAHAYWVSAGAGGIDAWATPAINGTSMGTAEGAHGNVANSAGNGDSLSRAGQALAVAAAAAFKLQYRQNNDRIGFEGRWLRIRPIRVG